MARKRRRGGRRGLLPKTLGGFLGLGIKVAGGLIVASPLISGVTQGISSPKDIPHFIALEYGYDTNTNQINTTKLTGAAAATIVGLVIVKAGSLVGKMVR